VGRAVRIKVLLDVACSEYGIMSPEIVNIKFLERASTKLGFEIAGLYDKLYFP
jgi:hypothetical protein